MPDPVFVTDMVFTDFAIERAVLEPLGYEVVYHGECFDEDEVVRHARDAVAIMTCFARVNAAAIEGAARCRVVGRYGVGVDNIAVATATARGIPVTYVPDYCVEEVSEHTFALLLALMRKIVVGDRGVRAGGWPAADLKPMHRIAGRTLGVVGFGRIARSVAAKGAALGMRVIAHDPFVDDDAIAAAGAEPVTFDELLTRAHAVTVHVPLTDATRHLIGAPELAAMREDAVLVNTSRGPLVDGRALCAALRAGTIAGAGLDVLEQEPPPAGDELIQEPHLVVTPHVAFYSEESLVELKRKAAEAVAAVLEGRRPAAIVNPAVLAAADGSA